MKIAVIGGGTAGYMAAAQVTKQFPQLDLYQIYDSSMPTIGVGEGTQALFPHWLKYITGLDFAAIQTNCNATRKYGIKFENWGKVHQQFMHNFYPPQSAYGYHLSAKKLVDLLHNYVTATHIDKKVINTQSNGIKVVVEFSDRTSQQFDFVFDARGFPRQLEDNHYSVSLIPTNAALITKGEVANFNTATRTIARPHGWIFVIPLSTHTSYGYVYNHALNSRSEIEGDLYDFLAAEEITVEPEQKHLTFPNFIDREFCDGALMKIGNRAGFLEPLEATALGIIQGQITSASACFLKELALITDSKRKSFSSEKIDRFNKFLFATIQKVTLFISWHYQCGSCFDTKFWRFAKTNFDRELARIDNPQLIEEFQQFIQAGANFNFFQYFNETGETFAGLSSSSFYEVGTGIGYYQQTTNCIPTSLTFV